jgi:serine protease Do
VPNKKRRHGRNGNSQLGTPNSELEEAEETTVKYPKGSKVQWMIAAAVLCSAALAAQTAPTPAPAPEPPRTTRTQVYVFGSGSYLGVDVADVTSERAKELKLNEERGAEVTAVDSDAPAAKAGLKEHDVVLSLNGTRVESADQLRRMIHELPAGRNITLGISREGKPQTLTATLSDRRSLGSTARAGRVYTMPHVVVPPLPPMDIEIPQFEVITRSSTVRGLLLETLTPQLGDYFGAPNGRGLLVRSVEKGSPAEAAGLKAGDVIVKVNNEKVTDTSDWRSAIRGKTGTLTLGIVRDKREQSLTLKLPERGDSTSSEMRIFELPDMQSLVAQSWDGRTLSQTYSREVERSLREAQRQMERTLREQQTQIERQQREHDREIERRERERARQTLRDISTQ